MNLIHFLSRALPRAGEYRLPQFSNIATMGVVSVEEAEALAKLFRFAKFYSSDNLTASTSLFQSKGMTFDLLIMVKTSDFFYDDVFTKNRYRLIVSEDKSLPGFCESDFTKVITEDNLTLYRSNISYYDIFLPIGPNDYDIAKTSIQNKRNKLRNLREIYYCSRVNLDLDAVFIPESFFPFQEINILNSKGVISSRSGWYFQQLKQLYFPTLYKSALDRVICICTDVFFNTDVQFFFSEVPIITFGREVPHKPYFQHMRRLYPLLGFENARSAISHHGVFEHDILARLHSDVENFHQKSFYKVFIDSIDPLSFEESGAAEYEIYYNYLRLIDRKIITREPNYIDTGSFSLGEQSGADYFAYHWYLRESGR